MSRAWFAFLAVMPLALACDEELIITPATLAGAYSATVFTLLEGSQTTDVLAAGGTLTITLDSAGTTTGQLFIPASFNEGTDLTASMVGTFTLSGTVVTFDQAADTFVRDMSFSVVAGTLRGTETFTATTVTVRLTRT